MSIIQAVNSKANIKKSTNQDVPASILNPVVNRYEAVSTASQTVINLNFSVVTSGPNSQTDSFLLIIDGKTMRLGSGHDFIFTNINSDLSSSQITMNVALSASLNIIALKLGLKTEIENGMDSRFTQLYEYMGDGFDPFINVNEAVLTPTTTTGTPAAGRFYSTITNRANLTDLTQNLKAQMGVERIMVQNISQLQNEFGPNGEPVWSLTNDTFGQVRFIGSNWVTTPNTNGLYAYNASSGTESLEITFYGTGLNILTLNDSGSRNVTASVDGGAFGSNLIIASLSAVLDGRNYATNQLINVVSGLTLGIHTVQLRQNSTTFVGLNGFEILNESSSIKVNPGVLYQKGQKIINSAQASSAYNTTFDEGTLGTRGGRVQVYVKADGTIAKTVMPVNAASATLASADHTNEEVARIYYPREFGAGRTDDFSTLSSAVSDRAFTLDDGSTTLVGSQVTLRTFSNQEVLMWGSSGSFITFTFVGTGCDYIRMDTATGGADTFTLSIDGGSATTFSTTGISTAKRIQKLVSGLPYGSHTIKITRTSTPAIYDPTIVAFVVYQPKRYGLQAGEVELADYNIMANYVANATAGLETIGTGVLRKSASREFVYIDGTGGTTSWNVGNIITGLGFFQLGSDRSNAALQYTFFGTGFEFRFDAGSNRSSNISVTLNGLAATTANFATLTSSVYGTGVTFSSGVLDQQDAAGVSGSGLSISGLPLALYTIKFNNNTASSFIIANSFDIITPIHSHKSNIAADYQNTLNVGSNSISDNRRFSPVKDTLSLKKNWVQAVGITSSPTYTFSASPVTIPLPDMSAAIKTSGGDLKIDFRGSFSITTLITLTLTIYLDGIAIGTPMVINEYVANAYMNASNTIRVPVSTGWHKVDVYWSINTTGVITAASTNRILTVEEV